MKVSRNDPCPCGSGKKYKKCCWKKRKLKAPEPRAVVAAAKAPAIEIPSAHPDADPARASNLNLEYQQALLQWGRTPWWKRMFARRPRPPAGI